MEILNKYFKLSLSVYRNENLTIDEFFKNYETVLNSETEIKAELKSKTVKKLKIINHNLGNYTESRDKKQDLIDKAFDAFIDYFLLERSVSYVWGEKTHNQAREEIIKSTTSEFLSNFIAEQKQKRDEREKAIANPETLEQFEKFIRVKGKDALTAEQIEKFEQLKADVVIERQKQIQKQKEEKQKRFQASNNVELELHETKHSKTGADIFTAVIVGRVEKSVYFQLRTKAKEFGGYYSRYTNMNINPPIKAGFNFSSKEDAVNFIGVGETKESEKETNVSPVKEMTVSDKMRKQANAMIEKAQESLSQSRTTNTHRQIQQAANAESKAESEIVFAKTLLSIANGFDNGTVKYLYKLNNKKQLEQLKSILSVGSYTRRRGLDQGERMKLEKDLNKDVNFVKYPYPCYSRNIIYSIFKNYADTKGMILDVRKILKHANSNRGVNDLITLKDTYTINLYKKAALKITDKWDKERILDPIKNYECVCNMGLVDLPTLKTALRELILLSQGTEMSEAEKQAKELKELERSFKTKKIEGFFPTPELLVQRMLRTVKVYDGETILEPSAGLGHIAQAVKEMYPTNELDLIEINGSLSEVLEKKGFNVDCTNFLNTNKRYDVIFMNPPFEKNQDIEHVMHAYDLLNEGGRLVAIMAGNKNGQSKKIQEFAEFVNNNGHMIKNEEGAFKDSYRSTNVNTVTVYLEK